MGKMDHNAAARLNEAPIVLIDGHCHLCHRITRYLVEHDKEARFRFAALQSSAGQKALKKAGFAENRISFDSFVLITDGRCYTKSGAALRVWRGLGGWRSLGYALIIIPSPIRDAVYDFIARNRYRWFGRSEQCMLPTKEIRDRFLPDGY